MGRKREEEDFNTRGTIVSGLQYSDVKALDVFEGDVSFYSPVELTRRNTRDRKSLCNLYRDHLRYTNFRTFCKIRYLVKQSMRRQPTTHRSLILLASPVMTSPANG